MTPPLSCSPRVSRFSYGGLPTIEEDQTYEATSYASGSPASTSSSSLTWTGNSMDWHCDGPVDSTHTSQDIRPIFVFEQCCPDNQQACNQQYCGPTEADVDAEELLLAAIDMRLRELLQMRAQRQAAAACKARSAPAAAPVDHTMEDLACWPFEQMPVLAASAAAAPAAEAYTAPPAHPYSDPYAVASQQGVARAPAYAPAPTAGSVTSYAQQKLQELQQVQNMQLALQRELMELLYNGY